MNTFIAFLIILLPVASASNQNDKNNTDGTLDYKRTDVNRIIGGRDAVRGQFPWQVSIRRRETNKHACGGALIGQYWVLTAGHCTEGKYEDPHESKIVVGILKVESDGAVMDILMILLHPEINLDVNHQHDLSLIRTKRKIYFNRNYIWPAGLPDYPTEPGSIVRISGWGYIKFNGQRSGEKPSILQYEQTTVISREECKAKIWRKEFIAAVHSYTTCTLDTAGHGTCHGDSGGPVVDAEDQLVGIVSWGKSCAQGYPDVHMSTYYHREWIDTIMAIYDEINEEY